MSADAAALPADPQAATLHALKVLMVKRGVTLGRLSPPDLHLALGLASLCLPTAAALPEFAVNAALKAWLAGDGAFLRIDHVELRRTLIDLGFWQRDGFGSAYTRAVLAPLHPAHAICLQLQGLDLPAVVAGARAAHAQQRAQRRAAFDAG